jgi:hypothetical protein
MQIPAHFAILLALERGVSIMAGVEEKAIIQDPNETALKEFEAGLARAIRQYKSGQVETFEDKDEFLRTLVE